MEGLDLGQTSNPSLAWKRDVFKMNDGDDDDDDIYIYIYIVLYIYIST